jgi:hypothetical protein
MRPPTAPGNILSNRKTYNLQKSTLKTAQGDSGMIAGAGPYNVMTGRASKHEASPWNDLMLGYADSIPCPLPTIKQSLKVGGNYD